MASDLTDLIQGDDEPAYDEVDDRLQIPDGLDLEKFNRGRVFFKKHVGQCLLTMMMSLIAGLSIERFLNVLVCTGMSSTPATSFKRYMNTTFHVLKWHYGNVWDKESSAFKSVRSVRKIHAHVRKFMEKRENSTEINGARTSRKSHVGPKRVYLSQYEMGLVQSGFIGVTIMYPKEFGIHCTVEELDDYVYFWRWMGYLLGIDDKYNICIDGYKKAKELCHAIQREIVIPSLTRPPEQYYPMADAFVDTFKRYQIASTKSFIAVGFRKARLECPVSISFTDSLRMYAFSGFLSLLSYFPSFAYCFNRLVEVILQCQRIS